MRDIELLENTNIALLKYVFGPKTHCAEKVSATNKNFMEFKAIDAFK